MKAINVEGLRGPIFGELDNHLIKQIILNARSLDEIFLNKDDAFKNILKELHKSMSSNDIDYLSILKQVILDTFWFYDIISKLYDEIDFNKIKDLIKKKQYNAKLIKNVYGKINFILQKIIEYKPNGIVNYVNLFNVDFDKRVEQFQNDLILKQFKDLKEKVDNINAGIHNECYLNFTHFNYSRSLNDELNQFVIDKYGYNLNNKDYDYSYGVQSKRNIDVLALILLNSDIWGINYSNEKNYFYNFLNIIVEKNGITHAKKIITYCFDELLKYDNGKRVIENKWPLSYIVEDQELKVKEIVKNTMNKRFEKIFLNPITDEEVKNIFNPDTLSINNGKKIFDDFIKSCYPTDYEKVISLFNNLESIIQDFTANKNFLNIEIILSSYIFGNDLKSNRKEYFYDYYPNFKTKDSILNRFYYQIYLINIHTNKSIECIYEWLFDVLRMIDIKYETKCVFAIDENIRNENYFKLKSILFNYNLNLKDDNKENYIISLLDRKNATINESSKFAELEQFGDAIYEFAVANILFYNPEYDSHFYFDKMQELVKATSQCKIANHLGIDKLYISNLYNIFNSKYEHNGKILEGFRDIEDSCIADSLEMIIGSIAIEFGVQKALDFTTKIILECNNDIEEPIKLNFNDIDFDDINYDEDYLKRIFPNPFDDEYSNLEYLPLGPSLNKLLLIISIGNDTIEKRIFISRNLGYGNEVNNDMANAIKKTYLYHGLEAVIEKYSSKIATIYTQK